MHQKIIMRLHQNPAYITWLEVDGASVQVHEPLLSGPNVSPEFQERVHFYVLVPSEDVLLTEIQLPKAAWSKVRKAIPFLVEEQLVTPLAKSHYVYTKQDINGKVRVAVVDHEKMREWIALLHKFLGEKRDDIRMLIPDVLCLPWTAETWSAYIEDNRAIIRLGIDQGLAIDKNNFSLVLEKLIHETLEQYRPKVIIIYSTEASPIELPSTVAGIKIQIQGTGFTTLEFLAKGLADHASLNLMRGPYQMNRKLTNVIQKSKIAGLILAAGLSIAVVGNVAQLPYLSYKQKTQQEYIAKMYHEVFPNSQTVVDPQLRFTRELRTLESAQQQMGFLKLMTKIAPVLIKNPQVTLQAINYDGAKLTLDINSTTLAAVDQFMQTLKQQQLAAQQSNVNSQDKQVHARILIS